MHHAPSALPLLLIIITLIALPFIIEHTCQRIERKRAHRRAIRQRFADMQRDSYDTRHG